MNHTLCHFEIPTDDIERAKKFYSELFGWTFEEAMGGYHHVKTGAAPEGGLFKRPVPEAAISIYISVESVDEYVEKAKQLGSRVVKEKTAVPGIGFWAFLMDTEGNVFGIFEENTEAK